MHHTLTQDSARWAFEGLGAGVVLAILISATMSLGPEPTFVLAIFCGGVGMCLGPLSLIVYRAAQAGGARRLEYGALWGAGWGFVLGSLYWFLYDNTFPLWHVVLPMVILSVCGLINAALNIDTESQLSASHVTTHHHQAKPST
jgi:hypothetical protein